MCVERDDERGGEQRRAGMRRYLWKEYPHGKHQYIDTGVMKFVSPRDLPTIGGGGGRSLTNSCEEGQGILI
jgi:hypothetical protein